METEFMKAQYGYLGKMLFVDLTHGKAHEEDLSAEVARDYIGGYGVGVRVLMERMKPGVDPLGPDNILGFGTGPLVASDAHTYRSFAPVQPEITRTEDARALSSDA
jgi:aldehyde:ferredoxin oxidoreductase